MAWTSIKAIVATVALCSLLAGCTTGRFDGSRAPDPGKALIVGSITEGYLTQPHGLMVHIRKVAERYTTVPLATLGAEDDEPSPNRLGNLFMYEVPAGSYEIYQWNYRFYRGETQPRPNPIIFKVKAGETAYIGDFSANALTFCLYNVNNADTTVPALKHKYPVLEGRIVENLSAQTAFEPWPDSDARDNGRGLCKF
ncbi:hypothetical protein DYL59_13080 [Pseudomonas kairouanensis]|uniref:DUF2846 domain-containing protein n=1 Tax=Pseudomonas kairouanensis TaxID=2293832 RepID=A0A4Z0ARS9_9PSED|nr:hypothetical protein [Pseudomonas kairouanensis]TFY89103.1 hypothetical protein DYL59_13080 [Pseudomonas kairouanensis]